MARLAARFRKHAVDLALQLIGGREERCRVEVALNCDPASQEGPYLGERQPPVDTHHVDVNGCHVLQQCRSLVGKVDQRHVERLQCLDHTGHRREREAAVLLGTQQTRPGIEDHERPCARRSLRAEVQRHRVGKLLEQLMGRLGLGKQEALGGGKRLGPPPLHQIAEQGERRAGKPYERHVLGERANYCAHSLEYERHAFLGIGHPQLLYPGRVADRIGHDGARREVQRDTHPLHRCHDVAEEDRRIQGEPPGRLEGDFRGQLRRFGEGKKIHGLPNRPVLRQIPSRLPHDPDRRVGRGLGAASGQKRRRLGGGVRGHELKTSANTSRAASRVRSMSASVWAAERKSTSNGLGAR